MGRRKIEINKQALVNFYIKKNLNMVKIAKKYKCSSCTVSNRLKEYKVKLKTLSFAQNRYKKINFDGSLQDKAYLIGFYLGDLNSYKRSKGSETIVVRCHTTDSEQVKLIKQLFKGYGKVTVSVSRYGSNVNCFLNLSFKFLLAKRDLVPGWIKKQDKFFWPFFAGYIDAEGNFQLNQGRARFKIDSYDYLILKWSSSKLVYFGIENKLWQIGKKGNIRSNRTKFNKNLWRITINKAAMIKKFIRLIFPHLKHRKQMRNAKMCLDNIIKRHERGTVYAK